MKPFRMLEFDELVETIVSLDAGNRLDLSMCCSRPSREYLVYQMPLAVFIVCPLCRLPDPACAWSLVGRLRQTDAPGKKFGRGKFAKISEKSLTLPVTFENDSANEEHDSAKDDSQEPAFDACSGGIDCVPDDAGTGRTPDGQVECGLPDSGVGDAAGDEPALPESSGSETTPEA